LMGLRLLLLGVRSLAEYLCEGQRRIKKRR
jgi:hypothetical protein